MKDENKTKAELTKELKFLREERKKGVFKDITECKQAEEEQRLHAAMMHNVAEGVYLIGLDDFIIKWTNERFTRMFGYDPGEMVGMLVDSLNAPTESTPTETRISIANILKKTGEWHGEVKNIKRDGTHFWCYANVSLFDHPEYGKVIVSVHTDISERKQVAIKLIESEEKYRELVDSSKDGIVITDSWGKISFANTSYAKMLGYKNPKELIGKQAIELHAHPEQRKKVFKQITDKGFLEDLEVDLRKKDGSIMQTSSSVTLKKDKNGNIIQTQAIVRDITERKQAEEKLKKSEQKFKNIVQSLPLGIHIYKLDKDSELRFIGANPSADKILGIDNSQYIGKTIHEAFPNISKTEIPNKFKEIAEKGGKWEKQDIIYKDNLIQGAFKNVNFQSSPGTVISMFDDITERKQAEEEIRKKTEDLNFPSEKSR